MDVKASFHSALRGDDRFSIDEFTTWPLLCQFEASRNAYGGEQVLVKPDGYFCIREKESDAVFYDHSFFLELDRSSETQDTLINRAACYIDYYKSSGFAVRNGGERSAYRDFPFPVVMILKTAEGRNNTAERLLQIRPPILRQIYITTFKEVVTDPLGAIWVRPVDYRAATDGTPYTPKDEIQKWGYKRQSARELFVEGKIRKCRLLDDEVDIAQPPQR